MWSKTFLNNLEYKYTTPHIHDSNTMSYTPFLKVKHLSTELSIVRYYLDRHRKLLWKKPFARLQLTMRWNQTSYINVKVMKRWSLPRRWLPEAGDKNTKSSMASSMHMTPMVNLFHRGIQRVGSRILMQRMFVWELTIAASHRPHRRPKFNIDCNHIRQHWYGGS